MSQSELLESTITPRKPRRGYAGLSAAALEQQRQQRLLDAALELFGTQGYTGTNIEQLCRHAKVTTRHFYEAFNDKESLLLRLFDQLMRDTLAQVAVALLGSEAPMSERLNDALHAFVQAQLGDPRRARITTIEILGVSQKAELHRHQIIDQFVQLIEAYFTVLVQQHGWPARRYRVWAVAIVGAMHELQMTCLNNPQVFDQESIVTELQALVAILQRASV